ncbi:hypothetical protein [Allobranchiibius sp. CTAmp26]|uniref:hypothetical protein n=1 Tax=Allobranchiibius sp. CTAmp26 TaxID=2815214 RepID=UPI001AA1732B|nr:hypothetical protein [Allobranchiibius sp. CTAmp26]MBO1756453.1 hypothetical protein [Allobranchiibius sp. CTAmp26]
MIEPTSECTRYISIDFTLESDLMVVGSSTDTVLVPLGLCRKGPLTALSIRGPSGKPAPLLETTANGEHAVAMLVAMALSVANVRQTDDLVNFRCLIESVVFHQGAPDPALASKISAGLTALGIACESEPAASFAELIQQFESNFLMVVELDADVVGRRSIVKIDYREPRGQNDLAPWKPKLVWQIPEFGTAASTHVEFSSPPLLLVSDAELIEGDADTGVAVARSAEPAATVHLVARPNSRFSQASAIVTLAPRRYGAITALRVGGWSIVAVVVLGLLIRHLRSTAVLPTKPLGTSFPTVLLAVGGLLLTWIARSPEDWSTSRILLIARRSLLSSALLTVLVAGYLAIPVGGSMRSLGWCIILGLAVLNAVFGEVLWRRCRIKALRSQSEATERTA